MSADGPPGRLTITRHHARVDAIRAYRVLLDGNNVGEIGNDSSIELSVRPGVHEVYLKVDWCQSQVLSIDVRPDENAELGCRPAATFRSLLLMITVGRKRYIDLRLTRRSSST